MRLLSKPGEKFTLLNLSSHSRVHLMENRLYQFVQTEKADFLIGGGGQLVVQGTKHLDFERVDDDDDKKND